MNIAKQYPALLGHGLSGPKVPGLKGHGLKGVRKPTRHRRRQASLLAEIQRLAQKGQLLPVQPMITVEQLKAQWLDHLRLIKSPNTVLAAEATLGKWMQNYSASRHPDHVTPKQIDTWVNPVDSELSLSSRRCRLSFIRSFFRYALATDNVERDPTALIEVKLRLLTHRQKEQAPRKAIADEQIAALLHFLRHRMHKDPHGKHRFWYVATALGRYAGLRMSDVCLLERASIDDTPDRIVVWTRKKGKRVSLPVAGVLAEAIALIKMPQTAGERKFCFPVQREMYLDNHQRTTLCKQFSRLCASVRAIGPGAGFHDLRRAYITEQVNSGLPLHVVARLVGHSSINTTMGYVTEESP